MNKTNLFFSFLLVIVCQLSVAQSNFPSVVVQSGFSNDITTHFLFSQHNNYLYGYNDIGEFILWEVRSEIPWLFLMLDLSQNRWL